MQPRAFYVMDRAYTDFARLYTFTRSLALFRISQNAVKTQIWIAISVYLLVAILKKKLKNRPQSRRNLENPQHHTFEKVSMNQLFTSWIKILQSINHASLNGPKACPWAHRIVANTAKDLHGKQVRRQS